MSPRHCAKGGPEKVGFVPNTNLLSSVSNVGATSTTEQSQHSYQTTNQNPPVRTLFLTSSTSTSTSLISTLHSRLPAQPFTGTALVEMRWFLLRILLVHLTPLSDYMPLPNFSITIKGSSMFQEA